MATITKQTHANEGRSPDVGSGGGFGDSRRWYTDTPRIPPCSDMRLLRRKPRKKHVAVYVVPVGNPATPAEIDARIKARTQPPVDNAHVAPGCDLFESPADPLTRKDLLEIAWLLRRNAAWTRQEGKVYHHTSGMRKAMDKDADRFSRLSKKARAQAMAMPSPNVKDEPRRDLAQSMRSMICDKSRRWLWRLVRRFGIQVTKADAGHRGHK